ncbi:MAG: zinc-binding dehydrogenase, partial [Chloroflexi bacterium]|nr:zinc-binding dehydrogenase [Chloroflexota bacterium]
AIGLSIAQVCRAYGAEPILLSEPLEYRRRLAVQLGCAAVADPSVQNPAEVMAQLTGSAGADIAFEASGARNGPDLAARCVGSGGALCLVGIPDEDELLLQASVVRRREMTVRTVRRYCGEFPEAVSLLASGRVKAGGYTTHQFSLEETGRAFEAAVKQPGEIVRAMVTLP